MAKATITLTDEPGGMVNLVVEWDPPVTEDSEPSAAQFTAMEMVRNAVPKNAKRSKGKKTKR